MSSVGFCQLWYDLWPPKMLWNAFLYLPKRWVKCKPNSLWSVTPRGSIHSINNLNHLMKGLFQHIKPLFYRRERFNRFPASRGPFSFVFAELTDGTKRDLCHGSKWTVLSMRHGYLATETLRDAFSTWSADGSHLSQLARQKTPAQFCCREWRVHLNNKKSTQFV